MGADPEFFLQKDGKPFSGVGLVPGTKDSPQKVKLGAVQLDGLAAEFNIDPASTKEQFITNVQTVLNELRKIIPQEFDFDYSPTAIFDEKHFLSQPKYARELGCNPDFNAYTMRMNPQPNEIKFMRTAAGHIHVGWTDNQDPLSPDHFEICSKLVRQLDITLGLPSIVLDPNKERRAMYGKAGAFRPKSYGLEYRVLSNFWLKTEELMSWVWTETVKAMLQAEKGVWYNCSPKLVQKAINTSNIGLACSLLGKPLV